MWEQRKCTVDEETHKDLVDHFFFFVKQHVVTLAAELLLRSSGAIKIVQLLNCIDTKTDKIKTTHTKMS